MVRSQNRIASRVDEQERVEMLSAIEGHDLPPPIVELLSDYQSLEESRPTFMWKWVHKLAPANTLPSVDDRYTEKVPIDKTIAILFITILDDTLEKAGDVATFNELTTIPLDRRWDRTLHDDVDREIVRVARDVWDTLMHRLEEAPHFNAYEELFRFDLKRAFTAIEYSHIVSRHPELATVHDLRRIDSHNMVMFAYGDIDLMHSPLAIRSEMAELREVIGVAQRMARIGNWVSTWERELREGDLSAAPIVYAVELGLISTAELQAVLANPGSPPEGLIERIRSNEVIDHFLERWEAERERLVELDADLATVDLAPFIAGTDEVLRYHLASEGYK